MIPLASSPLGDARNEHPWVTVVILACHFSLEVTAADSAAAAIDPDDDVHLDLD